MDSPTHFDVHTWNSTEDILLIPLCFVCQFGLHGPRLHASLQWNLRNVWDYKSCPDMFNLAVLPWELSGHFAISIGYRIGGHMS